MVVWCFFCGDVFVVFFCGGPFMVVFLWWCFCGVLVVRWCFCVFVVMFLWWCSCGGVFVVMFLWWCGGVFGGVAQCCRQVLGRSVVERCCEEML